ncbi:IS110 family transposase [Orientia tsutsugamushi]|nr:IS110 family transposase [Orientia tsutsugamushi]
MIINSIIVGIDISKETFDASVLINNKDAIMSVKFTKGNKVIYL